MTAVGTRATALGFDFDHTLGLDHKLERAIGLEMAGASAEREIDLALAAFRYGVLPIDEALRAAGIDPERFRERVLKHAPDFVTPLPGARELLSDLRRNGVRVAVLSNGWSPLQEMKAKLVGFDGPVLVSETMGVRKPHVEAFRRMEAALGTAARHIAYVGDDPISDVLGAVCAGMQGIWFDAEGRSYPQDMVPASARVSALAEVLTFVQGPQ